MCVGQVENESPVVWVIMKAIPLSEMTVVALMSESVCVCMYLGV